MPNNLEFSCNEGENRVQGGYYADITEEARCQVCNFVVVVAVLMSTKYKKHDRGGSLSGYISYLVLVLGLLMERPYTNSHKDIGLGKKYFSPVIFVPDVCIIFFPAGFPHLRLGRPLWKIVHLLLPLPQRHRFQPTVFHL